MHDYAVYSNERRNVVIGLALVGILAAYLFNRFLDLADLNLPWWVDAPAAFGFASLFYGLNRPGKSGGSKL